MSLDVATDYIVPELYDAIYSWYGEVWTAWRD